MPRRAFDAFVEAYDLSAEDHSSIRLLHQTFLEQVAARLEGHVTVKQVQDVLTEMGYGAHLERVVEQPTKRKRKQVDAEAASQQEALLDASREKALEAKKQKSK